MLGSRIFVLGGGVVQVCLFYSLQRGVRLFINGFISEEITFPGFWGSSIINPGGPPLSRGPTFSGVGDPIAIFNRNPYNL